MKYKSIIIVFAFIALYAWYISTHKVPDTNRWPERDAKLSRLDDEMKSLSEEIKFYQGHSECTQDSQCRVVGIGAKVCDKYRDFIVYSTQDAQETILLEKISKFNEKANVYTELSMTSNSCGKSSSKIECIKNRCEPVSTR